jgi:16S rRNA (guanine1207-N2)-methyltransferase
MPYQGAHDRVVHNGRAMAHYFSNEPDAPSHRRTVHLTLPDGRLELTTDSGVFSADQVDPGTRVLLAEAPAPPQGPVTLADVGCGYGPLAVALALRSPEAVVWAVDVNTRALELCRLNARRAGVADRIKAVTPGDVPDDLRLDGLWSNPPIRIGKPALQALLELWLARLEPGAKAHLVVHKHLGSDSLTRWIATRGHDVERLISRRGYRVLEVTTATADDT